MQGPVRLARPDRQTGNERPGWTKRIPWTGRLAWRSRPAWDVRACGHAIVPLQLSSLPMAAA